MLIIMLKRHSFKALKKFFKTELMIIENLIIQLNSYINNYICISRGQLLCNIGTVGIKLLKYLFNLVD